MLTSFRRVEVTKRPGCGRAGWNGNRWRWSSRPDNVALKFKEIFELVHELNMEPWIFRQRDNCRGFSRKSSGGAKDSAHRQFGGHSGATRDRYPQCNCAENRGDSQVQFVLVDVLAIIVLSSRLTVEVPNRLMLSTNVVAVSFRFSVHGGVSSERYGLAVSLRG